MKNNKKTLYIAEFARLAGVHPLTVRNYQKKGLLPDRRHPFNKYRVFTMSDLKKFKELVKA